MMKLMKNNIAAAFLVVAAAALSACGTLNPLSHAQTVEQKAYALYGEFVVIEEQAAEVVNSPDVSKSIRLNVAEIDSVAKASADSLLDAGVAVKKARDDLSRGASTEEKLVIATANLQKWYDDLLPKLQRLATALRGVPK